MPTLQKFKLFATHCASIHNPTQSPTTSPLFLRRRRRRKTLRMFLTLRNPESDYQQKPTSTITSKRSKLKDLFLSASSSPINVTRCRDDDHQERGRKLVGIEPKQQLGRGIGPGSVRPVVQMFGCRNRMLLRKPWRPVLTTIQDI